MADATWCCTVAASDGVGEAGGSLLHGYCCAIYLASTKADLCGRHRCLHRLRRARPKGRHGAEEGGLDAKASGLTVYREALHRGRSPRTQPLEAIDTAGRAVVVAGGTVVVSMLGLIIMRLQFLTGLAFGTSTAVLVAVLAAITLRSAMLGFVGTRIDRLSAHRRRARGAVVKEPMWHRWSRLLAAPGWSGGHGGAWCARSAGCTVPAMRLGRADTGNDAKGTTTHGPRPRDDGTARRRQLVVPIVGRPGRPSAVDRADSRRGVTVPRGRYDGGSSGYVRGVYIHA